MIDEIRNVLKRVQELDRASEGDSDDEEINASQELKEASLVLVRKLAARDIAVAELLDDFDSAE